MCNLYAPGDEYQVFFECVKSDTVALNKALFQCMTCFEKSGVIEGWLSMTTAMGVYCFCGQFVIRASKFNSISENFMSQPQQIWFKFELCFLKCLCIITYWACNLLFNNSFMYMGYMG